MTLSHSCSAGSERLYLVPQRKKCSDFFGHLLSNFIFSCAFLAGVSAKYILLISPSIEEYLTDTTLGFDWTVKFFAVTLLGRYFLVSLTSVNNVHHDK